MVDILKHKLGLQREDNKEYFRLVNNYNIIGRKITFINKKILKIRTPRLFILCHYTKIKIFCVYMTKLQRLIDNWNSMYNNYVQKPSLTFSKDEEGFLGFLHYMGLLQQMDNKLNKHFDTCSENFIKVQERYSNQINFLIAIISGYISLIGLVLSLKTLRLL